VTTPRLVYFEAEDIIHITLADEPETHSVELGPNITAELNAQGELIGIEILEATSFLRDFVLESSQARLLHLPLAQPA
jgi:uncharacterized protein YuzE